MTTLAFPSLPTGRTPGVLTWGYQQKTFVHDSPFTADQQILESPSYRHTCRIGYRSLDWRDDEQ